MSDDDYASVKRLAERNGVGAADYCYAKILGTAFVKRPVGLAAASVKTRAKVSRAGHKGKKVTVKRG